MKEHWDQRKKLALGAIFNPATTWKAQGQELGRDKGLKKKKKKDAMKIKKDPALKKLLV